MFRKSSFSLLFVAAAMLAGSIGVFAQSAPVSGTVELQKADGVREPVAGALVEVYRVDIKAGSPSAKTGKKGEFSFAGLPLGGTFVFSVSAAGASPVIYTSVKAGQEKILITLTPGDGRKFTEDEVRKGAVKVAAVGTSELTAEQKKAQAEFEKQNAEITSKNKKMQDADETARKANDDGLAAHKAGDYDLAISKFNEGIAAVPDFVGSTPILLGGKISALKDKGFKVYKEGASSSDATLRRSKFDEANKSYDEALTAFQEAIAVIKRAEATTDSNEQKRRDILRSQLFSVAMEIHRLKAVGGVDSSKSGDANVVITEYIGLEDDPARKIVAQMNLGDIMRLTGDFEKAVASYRSVLATKPDHPEAMAGLGLSLFAQGAASIPEDKVKEQEGLNYMQKYTEIAPVASTDSQAIKELKVSVKEAVDYLKAQKMAPQKVPSPKKKP